MFGANVAKLNFTIPSPLDQDETFEKIKNFLSADNDFKKFDSSVTCEFNPADKQCKINGSQFNAELKVKNDTKDKAKVEINVEVGMALALFKGKIQEVLEKTVNKLLKS